MRRILASWQTWALLSASFAALTAVLAKVGVERIDPDVATFIRTLVVVAALAAFLGATGQWQRPEAISARTWAYLALSGMATGASWVCYFRALKLGDAARVAPVDKLSVVLVAVFAVAFLGERLSASNWLGVASIGLGAMLVALR